MGGWVTTNFSVSSRQGFKLWGLSPWLPSLADPCLTLAWASQLYLYSIIYLYLHSEIWRSAYFEVNPDSSAHTIDTMVKAEVVCSNNGCRQHSETNSISPVSPLLHCNQNWVTNILHIISIGRLPYFIILTTGDFYPLLCEKFHRIWHNKGWERDEM